MTTEEKTAIFRKLGDANVALLENNPAQIASLLDDIHQLVRAVPTTPGKPAAGPEPLASALPAPCAGAAKSGENPSNSPLAPVFQRLDHIEQALEEAGLLATAPPAAAYATPAQKTDLLALLNHRAVPNRERTRSLLNLDRFSPEAADQKIADLRALIAHATPTPAS